MTDQLVSLSKLLSLVLRHKPEEIGIELDGTGWTDVDVLLDKLAATGKKIDRVLLERIVRESDKQRFALSADGKKIRANQGHSAMIDLGLLAAIPPGVLFHGTATRFVASILKNGLNSGARMYVHLSSDIKAAFNVGARHGEPTVLLIDAKQMHLDGHVFNLSENGVWLVHHVPPTYIEPANHGTEHTDQHRQLRR